MFRFIGLCFGTLVRLLRARRSLLLENLALRQQLAVLKPRMAAVPHCGHARNGGALAQGRIPFVLEADLQSQEAHRETTDIEGSSGIDFPDGC